MKKVLLFTALLSVVLTVGSCKLTMSDDTYIAISLTTAIKVAAWAKLHHYEWRWKTKEEVTDIMRAATVKMGEETCEDYGYTLKQYNKKAKASADRLYEKFLAPTNELLWDVIY